MPILICKKCNKRRLMFPNEKVCPICKRKNRAEYQRNYRKQRKENPITGKCDGHYNLYLTTPKPITKYSARIKNATFFIKDGLWYWYSDKYNIKCQRGFNTLKEARLDAANAVC